MDTQTRQLMDKINRNDKIQSDRLDAFEKRLEMLDKKLDVIEKGFIKEVAKKEAKKAKES
jgi:hypothetical protein